MNNQQGETVRDVVISLFDFTGIATKPWVDAGYTAYCLDIQHPVEGCVKNGANCHHADLMVPLVLPPGLAGRVAFVYAFPPCTHLAVSGAAHFKGKGLKALADSILMFSVAAEFCEESGAPYLIENPVSTISTYWRKPDHIFNPFEYGGYIPEEDAIHPEYPEEIAPRDAYPKKTCLWVGGGFVMPEMKSVEPEEGYSRQHKKLGGKSERTKNIRSATPRGFSRAVFEANKKV